MHYFKLLTLLISISAISVFGAQAQPQLVWSDAEIGQILRSGLDGQNPEAIVSKNFADYHVVDFDNGKIYWSDTGTNSVHSVDLDGSNQKIIIPDLTEPQGIDLSEAGELILVDHKRIAKFDTDGNFIADIVDGLDNPTDLVVHDDFIYWGDKAESAIFRASIDGMSQQQIISAVYVLVDIEVNTSTDELYWTQAPGIPNGSGIFKANLNGSGRQTVLEDFINGIAIDGVNDEIYYSESVTHVIHKASLSDISNGTVLVDEFLRNPITITIDKNGGRLFFLNEQFRDFLYVVSLADGSGLTAVASSDVYQPTRFAFDTLNNHIYWVNSKGPLDEDESAAIMRADMDGSNITELISYPQVEKPFDLALDLSEGRMYWSDMSKRGIYSAQLNGTDIEGVVTTGLLAPTGIALDNANNQIYWCDANTAKIQRAGKDGSDPADIISSGLESPYGLAYDASSATIYFTDYLSGIIGRFALGGEAYEVLLTTNNPGTTRPNSLYVDMIGDKIYYTVDHTDEMIMRADLDGSNPEEINVPDIASPHGIHVLHDVMSSTGRINQQLVQRASAYPNPFSTTMTVQCDSGFERIEMFNTAGQLVYSSSDLNPFTTHHSIKRNLPAGTYELFIHFPDGKKQVIPVVGVSE